MDTEHGIDRRIRTILVKKLGGIGNVVLGTPMLEYLGETYPDARITVLVESEEAQEVLTGNPYVHSAMIAPAGMSRRGERLRSLYGMIRLALRLRSERYDLVVNGYAGYGGGSLLSALFIAMIGAKRSVGYVKSPWRFLYSHPLQLEGEVHEVERNLRLARAFGPPSDGPDPAPRLWLSEDDKAAARRLIEEWHVKPHDLLIGMHAGSGGLKSKRWDHSKFAALADLTIRHLGARVVLLGGNDELDLAGRIMREMKETAISAVGKTTLKQTAAVIARCKGFISNDTGLMHIAAAMQVPVVAVFGPTNFLRTGPFGRGHRIVRADMPCIPCYRGRKGIACDHMTCLERVSVDDVFERVKELIPHPPAG